MGLLNYQKPQGLLGQTDLEYAQSLFNAKRNEVPSASQNNLLKYGKRPDGTYKAAGYFGELPIGNNNIATEYSVGMNINGKEMDIPSIVPTLTQDELNTVLMAARKGEMPPNHILEKARQHAEMRIQAGHSPFWAIPEKQYQIPYNYKVHR